MITEEKNIDINRLETNIEFLKARLKDSKSPIEKRNIRANIDRIRKELDMIKES